MAPEQGYGWPFQLLYQNCGHPGAELINLFVSVTDVQQKGRLFIVVHISLLAWGGRKSTHLTSENIRINICNIHINAVSVVP
jgi:hypothetical protein